MRGSLITVVARGSRVLSVGLGLGNRRRRLPLKRRSSPELSSDLPGRGDVSFTCGSQDSRDSVYEGDVENWLEFHLERAQVLEITTQGAEDVWNRWLHRPASGQSDSRGRAKAARVSRLR